MDKIWISFFLGGEVIPQPWQRLNWYISIMFLFSTAIVYCNTKLPLGTSRSSSSFSAWHGWGRPCNQEESVCPPNISNSVSFQLKFYGLDSLSSLWNLNHFQLAKEFCSSSKCSALLGRGSNFLVTEMAGIFCLYLFAISSASEKTFWKNKNEENTSGSI